MSEEKGFEVVDRRGGRTGKPEEEAAAAADAAVNRTADEVPDEEMDEEFAAGLPEMNVGGVLAWSVGMLGNLAWINMGVIANPLTGRVERNLPEARRAIDALSDVVKHLRQAVSPAEQRDLDAMLSDLRINFVQQSQRSD